MFSWIFKVMCFVLELCLIAAFSKECIAKLVHGVLLLYLVVSSTLERYTLVAARVRRSAKLYCTDAAAINLRLCMAASIVVNYFPLSFPAIAE